MNILNKLLLYIINYFLCALFINSSILFSSLIPLTSTPLETSIPQGLIFSIARLTLFDYKPPAKIKSYFKLNPSIIDQSNEFPVPPK